MHVPEHMAELNDEELRGRLFQLGFSPGPITKTTRFVYEKKLAQLKKETERRISTSRLGPYSCRPCLI